MKILSTCAFFFIISALLKLRGVESISKETCDDSSCSTSKTVFDKFKNLLYVIVEDVKDLGTEYDSYLTQFEDTVRTTLTSIENKKTYLTDVLDNLSYLQIERQITEETQSVSKTQYATLNTSLCDLIDCDKDGANGFEKLTKFFYVEELSGLHRKMETLEKSLKSYYDIFKNQLNDFLLLYDLIKYMLRFAIYGIPKQNTDKESSTIFKSLKESYSLFWKDVETAHKIKGSFNPQNWLLTLCAVEQVIIISKKENEEVAQKTFDLMIKEERSMSDSLKTFLMQYFFLLKTCRNDARTKLETQLKHENSLKKLIDEFLKLFGKEESYLQKLYEKSVERLSVTGAADIPKCYSDVNSVSEKEFYVRGADVTATLFLTDYNSDVIIDMLQHIYNTLRSLYDNMVSCEKSQHSLEPIPLTETEYPEIQTLNNQFGTVLKTFSSTGMSYINLDMLLEQLKCEMEDIDIILENLHDLVQYVSSVNKYYELNPEADDSTLTDMKKVFASINETITKKNEGKNYQKKIKISS